MTTRGQAARVAKAPLPLLLLPDDALAKVAQHLPREDRRSMRLVCKALLRILPWNGIVAATGMQPVGEQLDDLLRFLEERAGGGGLHALKLHVDAERGMLGQLESFYCSDVECFCAERKQVARAMLPALASHAAEALSRALLASGAGLTSLRLTLELCLSAHAVGCIAYCAPQLGVLWLDVFPDKSRGAVRLAQPGWPQQAGLAPLSRLTALTSLTIAGECPARDLPALPSLEHLAFLEAAVHDSEVVGGDEYPRTLAMTASDVPVLARGAAAFPSLRHLELFTDVDGAFPTAAVTALTALESLKLHVLQGWGGAAPQHATVVPASISALQAVTRIEFCGCALDPDEEEGCLRGLACLEALPRLRVERSRLVDGAWPAGLVAAAEALPPRLELDVDC